MGMAHRGRLNVLCSVMRKSFDQLFEQFSESYIPDTVAGDGDVKYHLGYESVLTTSSGKTVEVSLAANPSTWRSSTPWSRAAPGLDSGSEWIRARGAWCCRY